MKANLIILPVLLALNCSAYAFNSGASFLKIDIDAKAVSMGSTYAALTAGVNSIGYNPAGLSAIKGVELGFSHTNWLMDSKHDFVGAVMPLKAPGWVLGLGVTRFANSRMDFRKEDRSAGGSFSSYDQAISFGSAKSIGKNRIGLSVKYIESSIAGEKAHAIAVDMGVSRALSSLPVSLGFVIQNLGTPMKYISQKDPLPLSLSAGLLISVVSGFDIAMDFKRRIYDNENSISVGTEYGVLSGLALRTGYVMNNGLVNARNKGFSGGAGLNIGSIGLDYAFTPFGELGNTQKITLRKRF